MSSSCLNETHPIYNDTLVDALVLQLLQDPPSERCEPEALQVDGCFVYLADPCARLVPPVSQDPNNNAPLSLGASWLPSGKYTFYVLKAAEQGQWETCVSEEITIPKSCGTIDSDRTEEWIALALGGAVALLLLASVLFVQFKRKNREQSND